MAEKYIRENKNSYAIVKNSRTYARLDTLEDAVFIRNLLVGNDWNLDEIPQTVKKDDNYLVLHVFDDKLHLLAKYKLEPDLQTIQKLIKSHLRNPNNSRYGLNITRIFSTFIIKKRIAGDDYIFGYYDNLEDAQFVRNFLLDNEWNVNAFDEIEFDEESGKHRLVKVIDDKAYVLNSFDGPDIDVEAELEDFLSKISKHKYGLASYPHLDLLKDEIENLEKQWGVVTRDDNWNFTDVSSPLTDIVFNLTPFEKSVFDAIDGETSFEDIEKSLMRFKSKNFEEKILKNLDRLIDLNLVMRLDGGNYKKTNL